MEEGTPIKLSITVNMAKFDAYVDWYENTTHDYNRPPNTCNYNYAPANGFLREKERRFYNPLDILTIVPPKNLQQTFVDVHLDGNENMKSTPKEKKIWNAVRTHIPMFGNEESIEISICFAKKIFSPIIPDSPWLSLTKHSKIALRILGLALSLIEIPFRALATSVFCRVMDIYSFSNPDFAEYYRFRAKTNWTSPIQAVSYAALGWVV